MKRKLFLCGPAFSGKSRLIREALGRQLQAAGGFCTELSSAGGVEGFEKELFLDLRQFPPLHDSEVFRESGVRCLEEAEWYPFAVLDEIGGMDLIIPQFRVALENLLRSGLPVLGVVKTEEDAEQLRQLLGPGQRFREFSERLHRALQADPDTEILYIDSDAAAEAGEAVRAWAAEYAAIPGL